jgi:hypothetical protein
MSDMGVVAVLLSMLLLVLYVLVPLVPAIAIYKIFPETKVTVSGPLRDLTVKATGAFAAYIVVFVLGIILLKHIQGLISGLSHQTTDVSARVVLLDEHGKPIADQFLDDLFNQMQVKIMPELDVHTKNEVKVSVPTRYLDDAYIQYQLQGFDSGHLKVSEYVRGGRRMLRVEMHKSSQPYDATPFPALDTIPPQQRMRNDSR